MATEQPATLNGRQFAILRQCVEQQRTDGMPWSIVAETLTTIKPLLTREQVAILSKWVKDGRKADQVGPGKG